MLITGVAGFIGFHLAKKRLLAGEQVIGIDNLNSYYDVSLKKARLRELEKHKNFTFAKVDIADKDTVKDLFAKYNFKKVANLAAQAGVRYSLKNPLAYIDSNIVGFTNIIENCRQYGIEHLVYASTSSVYGANKLQPFSESHSTEHPLSIYAATKKCNELIAHSYAHLYNLPSTGLRFFTVYGPWGRPDMALFLFTKSIMNNEPINVFNHGKMVRDFTYIDDVVEIMSRVIDSPVSPNLNWDALNPDPASSSAPYRIYNIGNNRPINLIEYIKVLEKTIGEKAKLNLLSMQDGDMLSTYADVKKLKHAFNYQPSTTIEEGITNFVRWYREYYGI